MLTITIPDQTTAQLIQRFIGCIVTGHIPQDVADAVDQLEEDDVPPSIIYLMKLWWGRNRDEKVLPDVIELLQDTLREML